MLTSRIVCEPAFLVGEADRRLFGSFVEHMGRCVYTGVYEPDHPDADDDGLRTDVLALTRELGVTVVRYPGGNFVSGYRWEDGVGPRDRRPARIDRAWRTIDPNAFGLDEFARWAGKADVEPLLAVNLGTRGVDEACALVEYANVPGGTALSDLRRSHGREQPYAIRMWCLGNEMDGPWQVGHKTATEYGRLAAESAKAMRLVDATLELVACGSSTRTMPTFGAWEAEVLTHTYPYVDHISLHSYYDPLQMPLDDYLAVSEDMDEAIRAVVSTADAVAARLGERRRMTLSFDEWNVWFQSASPQFDTMELVPAPRSLIEDSYSAADATVVGSLLVTLLRNCDRVAIACQAQLVNILAPILTEPGGPALRQTIFYPFADVASLAGRRVLRVEPQGASVQTERYGEVPAVLATATLSDDDRRLVVFAVNRHPREDVDLRVDLPGGAAAWRPTEHRELASTDLGARNTFADPDRVTPVRRDPASPESVRLAPASWNVLLYDRAG